MFNPNLLTDEERQLVLDLCESINKQCDELRKTLDEYRKEADNGSQN